MPNVEAIRAWIEDLRTTDAPQGRKRLRSGDSFCCLGRACEVYRIQTGRGSWDWNGYFTDGEGFREPLVMPAGVVAWLGLEEYDGGAFGNPTLVASRGPTVAAALNDFGVSFVEISDAIERTYLSPEIAHVDAA